MPSVRELIEGILLTSMATLDRGQDTLTRRRLPSQLRCVCVYVNEFTITKIVLCKCDPSILYVQCFCVCGHLK